MAGGCFIRLLIHNNYKDCIFEGILVFYYSTAEAVRKNINWLKTHHREYHGQWFALDEGVLVGANTTITTRIVYNKGFIIKDLPDELISFPK